ncbi:MAG: PEP-CTERM sorting domain-containing protein [Puniceicoccales bacterium]
MLGSVLATTIATQAAVIDDAPLAEGPGNIIANYRGIYLTGSGSTSATTIEALDNAYTMHDYSGATNGNNVFAFTDNTLPDIQISSQSSFTTIGTTITNTSWLSSTPNAYRIQLPTDTTTAYTMSIDFGNWDSGSSSFTDNVNAVSAAAFTLTAPQERFKAITSMVVNFVSATDEVLSSQTILSSSLDTSSSVTRVLYFGYESDSNDISSISITFNVEADAEAVSPLVGLNDLTFTTIPEPSTSALGLLGAAIAAAAFIRRRRS